MILILETLIFLIGFALISFFVFYTIGFLFIKKVEKELEGQEVMALSYCAGIILFLVFAVVFGFLNLRVLVTPLVVSLSLISFLKFRRMLLKPWKIFVADKWLLLLILLGILVQGFINFPSGFLYHDGLYFWSSQGHDGLWHVALMEEIKKVFPPQNPVFSGEPLYNYHYLVDVVMGEYGRIFPFFNSLDLYFRFFPVLFSFLIGLTAYAFVSRWQGSRGAGRWAIFFSYFVGSFGYVVTYLHRREIFAGETVFWAAQGNTIIGNPPHAMGYILLTAFLLSFYFFTKERKYYWLVISLLLIAFLAGFKVSAGFVLLVGLIAASLYDFWSSRHLLILFLALLAGILNLLTFKLMTKGGSSLLMFLPWWFVRTMVVTGDRLDWIDLELRRQHYLAQGTWKAWLRVIQIEAMSLVIFIVGNLGMRIIGFREIFRRFFIAREFQKNPLEILMITTMISSLIIPLLFVQRGIIYNNIQFMQYFLLIFGFYGAATIHKLILSHPGRWAKRFVIIVVILFSSPTVIGNLVEFYAPPRKALAKVTNQELEALSYLRNNSEAQDIVLTKPFNEKSGERFRDHPRPIYFWYNTAYVSALSSRRSFVADEEQLMITTYPKDARLLLVKKFFNQEDFQWNKQFLADNHIKYLYLSKKEIEKELNVEKNNLVVFYENDEVIVYKVEDF